MLAPALRLSFLQRLCLWQLTLLASGVLLWARRRVPPGSRRLALALPLIVLNALAPFAFHRVSEVMILISVFVSTASVTNMKLVSWVMDRGALCRTLTLPQFLAVYALPITPADIAASPGQHAGMVGGGSVGTSEGEEEQEDSQAKRRRTSPTVAPRSSATHFRHFARKLVATVGVVVVMHRYGDVLPRLLRITIQGFSQYLGLSMTMDLLAAAVGATSGLAVAPHFNNPYLSTSFDDFWSRRWNLTVSAVLRSAVYDPVMEGRLVRRPGAATAPFSRTRRLAAVYAVFVVSGVMHELMFWTFAHRFTPGLKWLLYFCAHGGVVVAENVAKKALKSKGLQMPTPLARLLTLVGVNILVAQLWWPPVDELGIPELATEHTVQAWRAFQKAALGRWRA